MPKVNEILEERSHTHGEFSDHARMAQALKSVVQNPQGGGYEGYDELKDIQREALEMILHKIARIRSGNSMHRDHWDDIAGYATLVSERLGPRDD